MEMKSIKLLPKEEVELVVPLDVAKQCKTLANLLGATEESSESEPIRVEQFESALLGKVFEWCAENKEQSDFCMTRTFTNEYDYIPLTDWQKGYFMRNQSDLWNLAVSANYIDVPLLYYACCSRLAEKMKPLSARDVAAMFAIGKVKVAKEEVPMPKDVPDDIILDVLRFGQQEYLKEWKRIGPRWHCLIHENARILPLMMLRAYMQDDKVEIKPRSQQKRVNLEALNQYAVTNLAFSAFGAKQCAVVEEFLAGSNGRLRVRVLDAGGLPQESRSTFRSRLRTLTRFCDRLDFLEQVRIALSSDMHAESVMEESDLLAFPSAVKTLSLSVSMSAGNEKLLRFIEAVSSSWTRTLFINLTERLCDPIPVLTKLHKNFEHGALTTLVVSVSVADEAEEPLRGFLVANEFEEASVRDCYEEYDGVFAYEKERDDGWTMRVEYIFTKLEIEISK